MTVDIDKSTIYFKEKMGYLAANAEIRCHVFTV